MRERVSSAMYVLESWNPKSVITSRPCSMLVSVRLQACNDTEGHFLGFKPLLQRDKLGYKHYPNTLVFAHDQGPGSAQRCFVPARRDNCVRRKEKASLSHKPNSHSCLEFLCAPSP